MARELDTATVCATSDCHLDARRLQRLTTLIQPQRVVIEADPIPFRQPPAECPSCPHVERGDPRAAFPDLRIVSVPDGPVPLANRWPVQLADDILVLLVQ